VSRLARVVIPDLAHHITQRGNGRQQVFFADADYAYYLRLLAASCAAAHVSCLAFCLMPNHVHLILVPSDEDGLRRCLAAVHRTYAGALNLRRGLSGHFWQGRYGSVVMDNPHLYEALRYVLLNPVRAGLVASLAEWRWSSARVYLGGESDGLTSPWRMLSVLPPIADYLAHGADAGRVERLRVAGSIGRPAVDPDFLTRLEQATGRRLRPRQRGPTPMAVAHEMAARRVSP
jgi:putative transposase